MSFDLKQFEAVLLDLDGTVYHEEHALPGALELIRRLQRQKTPFACLTNSTSSPQRIAARLGRMGIDLGVEQIYTAAAAAVDHALQRYATGRQPRIYNLCTEGVAEMLAGRAQWIETVDEACDAVICGVPTNAFAAEERQRTAMLLLRKGAELVAICADRIYPSARGIEFGVGAMAAKLSYASGVTPTWCGKPQPGFFRELCHRIGAQPQRCVLIGDNLESDIAGGKQVGMKTALALCGIATREDAARLPPHMRPDWIINNLSEL